MSRVRVTLATDSRENSWGLIALAERSPRESSKASLLGWPQREERKESDRRLYQEKGIFFLPGAWHFIRRVRGIYSDVSRKAEKSQPFHPLFWTRHPTCSEPTLPVHLPSGIFCHLLSQWTSAAQQTQALPRRKAMNDLPVYLA